MTCKCSPEMKNSRGGEATTKFNQYHKNLWRVLSKARCGSFIETENLRKEFHLLILVAHTIIEIINSDFLFSFKLNNLFRTYFKI